MDDAPRPGEWLASDLGIGLAKHARPELDRLKKELAAAEDRVEELRQAEFELRRLELKIPQLRSVITALEHLLDDPDEDIQMRLMPYSDSVAEFSKGQRSETIKAILVDVGEVMSPQTVMEELERRHQLGVSQDPLRAVQAALRRLEQTDEEIARVGYGRYIYRPKEPRATAG